MNTVVNTYIKYLLAHNAIVSSFKTTEEYSEVDIDAEDEFDLFSLELQKLCFARKINYDVVIDAVCSMDRMTYKIPLKNISILKSYLN